MSNSKNKSNNFFVVMVIVLLLVFAIVVLSLAIKYRQNNTNLNVSNASDYSSELLSKQLSSADNSSSLTINSEIISSYIDENTDSKHTTDDWKLIVANSDNIVSDYYIDLSVIPSEFCQDGIDFEIDSRAYDDLVNMLYTAEDDGVHLNVLSSYRTYEYQNTLYQNKVSYYLNMGYEQLEAEKAAATVVAIPGTSDHNIGLACDFNYLEQEYEDTEELTWLKNNAERFGFVMRYPKGKEDITKIIYEPWHYRYVGVEHAKQMNKLNMCLEEYVEYLKNNG